MVPHSGHLSFTFFGYSAHPEENMPRANRINKERNRFFISIFISVLLDIIHWEINNRKEVNGLGSGLLFDVPLDCASWDAVDFLYFSFLRSLLFKIYPVRKPHCSPRVKLHLYRGTQRGGLLFLLQPPRGLMPRVSLLVRK